MLQSARRSILLLHMLWIWASLSVMLPAFAANSGQLRVLVIDASEMPLADVGIVLSGAQLAGGTRMQASDARGETLFRDLPPGRYQLSAIKAGFQGITVDNLQIDINRTTVHTLRLFPGGNEFGAAASAVATSSTTGQVLEKNFLQHIPAGRTYQNAVQSVPAVTGGGNPNMGGSAFNENTYMLDGSNITDPTTGTFSSTFRGAPPPANAISSSPVAPNIPAAPAEPAPKPSTETRPKRMVHHNGWVALSVPNPRETLDTVAALAEGAGGRTEQMGGNTVTIRVPVAKFREIWEMVLTFGEPLNQSVRADDVTDQHTALDLRLRVLKGTRDRLVALLAQSKTEMEKLRLLGEIARVTEQIDNIEAQLRTLADLAAMSRITVQAVPREAFTAAGARPEAVGFEWIPVLSPFRRGIWKDDYRVALPIPDKMVALDDKGPLTAESSGGTVLWTMRLDNNPIGSASFWIETIADRVSDEFADPTRRAIGSWQCLALSEPETKTPYRWEICVAIHDDKIHVAQSYYPDKDEFERYAAAIERALGAAGGGT